jgi:hypothetical protein
MLAGMVAAAPPATGARSQTCSRTTRRIREKKKSASRVARAKSASKLPDLAPSTIKSRTSGKSLSVESLSMAHSVQIGPMVPERVSETDLSWSRPALN